MTPPSPDPGPDPDPDPDPRTSPEWTIGALDLDAYLARIGVSGVVPVAPPAAADDPVGTLRRVHGAHVRAIGFENVDAFLGTTPDLDLAALQGKLVARGRGGYCYEHNLLLAAALERLGLGVERFLARVQMGSDEIRPRSHMCLVVEAGGRRWLADVGFGGQTLRQPLPFADGVTDDQEGGEYGLARAGATWRLRQRGAEGWYDLYVFREEPQHLVDVEVANHFTATHPSSPFSGQLVAQHRGGDARRTLVGTELTVRRPDGTEARHRLEPAEVPSVLERDFAVRLDAGEAAAVVRALDGVALQPEPA